MPDVNFKGFKKAAAFIGGLLEQEQTRLKALAYNHRDAWMGLSEDDKRHIPDRDIVSISIFNSGANWEERYFPDSENGCKITRPWASIVFKSKDDVMDLHGSDLAIAYLQLYKVSSTCTLSK